MTSDQTQFDESADPVIQLEEDVMLTRVDRELSAEQQGYAIGGSGLIPLRDFLNGHLPPFLRAVAGRITAPDHKLSSEPAVLIVDPRYPVLKEDLDGFALVMLHSVIGVIEVTSLLTTDAVDAMGDRVEEALLLLPRVEGYSDKEGKAALIIGFTYHSTESIEAIGEVYAKTADRPRPRLNLTVLRVIEKERTSEIRRGVELEIGPAVGQGQTPGTKSPEFRSDRRPTCLSDFWHNLVIRVHNIFHSRNLSDSEVEEQFGEYPSWSSYLGGIIQERRERTPVEEKQGEGEEPSWP